MKDIFGYVSEALEKIRGITSLKNADCISHVQKKERNCPEEVQK